MAAAGGSKAPTDTEMEEWASAPAATSGEKKESEDKGEAKDANAKRQSHKDKKIQTSEQLGSPGPVG